MLAAGDLEQVTPSTENATRLLAEAQRHLRSAALVADADPAGGCDLLYAAARKAMAAVLAEDLPKARDIVTAMGHLLPHLQPW